MSKGEKWIWLDEKKYPQYQTTIYSGCLPKKEDANYTVAEFVKESVQNIIPVKLQFIRTQISFIFLPESK